jgi:hypothetical protein
MRAWNICCTVIITIYINDKFILSSPLFWQFEGMLAHMTDNEYASFYQNCWLINSDL